MSTLVQFIELLVAGGPGSGCNPAAGKCGRPKIRQAADVIQHRQQLKKELDQVRREIKRTKRGKGKMYVKKERRERLKILREGLRSELRYYGRRDRLLPGMKRVGKLHTIPVEDVAKSRIKKQSVSPEGYKITELTSPKEYEKRGGDWLRKPDLYKGQYLVDRFPGGESINRTTYDNPKERNTFFIHNETPDKARSVEVHRNLGDKTVTVIQRNLGQYGSIVDHREVMFKNIGRASGFLMKRYGISFKLTGGVKS